MFKSKYRNLNTTNVYSILCAIPHSNFSIHTTLDQNIITLCLIL